MARWKVDHIWIFTQDDELVEVLGMGPEACPFFDGVMTETINGVDTLEFSIPGDHPKASRVIRGHVAVIERIDGGYRAFKIQTQWQGMGEEGIRYRRFYCEDIAVDELNVAPVIERRPTSPTDALEKALEHSIWEVGQVDSGFPSGSTSFYHESAMSAIQKIVETWGGEVRFRITHDGVRITGRYVDFLLQRGEDNGRRVVAGKDIRSMEEESDLTGLATALYGYGRGEEIEETGGFGRRISFADVEWSVENGDPVDKPKGQEWVGDPEALKVWGLRGGTIHRFDFIVFEDEEDPEELLRKTWEELQRRKAPRNTLSVSIYDLEASEGYEHEAVRIGDIVTVINDDMSPPLEYWARVIEIKRHLNEPEKTELIIGHEQPTLTDAINRVNRDLDNVVRIGDPLNYLNTIFQTLTDDLNRTLGYVYISAHDGILVTDKPKDQNPTSAIRIKGGMIAIANEWDPTANDFKWRAFGTGEGFTADLITAGILDASRVRIHSHNEDWTSEITLYDGFFSSYIDGELATQTGGFGTEYFVNNSLAGGVYASGGASEDRNGIVISALDYWALGRFNPDNPREIDPKIYADFPTGTMQISGELIQLIAPLIAIGPNSFIDTRGGYTYWAQSENSYIRQRASDGRVDLVMRGVIRHQFNADGTKAGGTIDIDGETWSMSPIDSPRVLIEDVLFDQLVNESGVTVEIEERLSKALSKYAVFPSRGDVVISDKTPTSFKVTGPAGVVDLRIVGVRAGKEDIYFEKMDGPGSSMQSRSSIKNYGVFSRRR